MSNTIYFYRVKGEKYGCFSNFSPDPLEIDGVVYRTSEHYYQSEKFRGTDEAHRLQIIQAATPRKAADLGRDTRKPLRTDWEQVKDRVMKTALLAKFSQSEIIRNILISTGDAQLVENTTKDTYWGCGSNGDGKNMLGKLLMEVRQQFRNEGRGV